MVTPRVFLTVFWSDPFLLHRALSQKVLSIRQYILISHLIFGKHLFKYLRRASRGIQPCISQYSNCNKLTVEKLNMDESLPHSKSHRYPGLVLQYSYLYLIALHRSCVFQFFLYHQKPQYSYKQKYTEHLPCAKN